MTAARRFHLLLAGAALLGHFPAYSAKPAISAAEIDAFLQQCAFIDIPYEPSKRLQGVTIRGMTPIHYIVASSGEGDVWGFEFDISVAEFKRRAPDLATRVDMRIPADEREYVVALYRVLEELSHASEPLRLVCRSNAIEGDDEP